MDSFGFRHPYGKPITKSMVRLIFFLIFTAILSCSPKKQHENPITTASPADSLVTQSRNSDSATDSRVVTVDLIQKPAPAIFKEREANAKVAEPLPSFVPIQRILNNLDNKPFLEFTIAARKDTTLVLPEGTNIKIPSNAFRSTKTGKKVLESVTLRVKEYYSLSDILLANLTTTTKSEALETGGMIHMVAYSSVDKDTLTLIKNIEIRFPFTQKKEGMQLFTGERNESDVIIWESDTDEVIIEESDLETAANDSRYYVVEESPTFPGGYEALANHWKKNTRYPAEARRRGIQGRVYVNIVISENGELIDKSIFRGIEPTLDQAALDAFNNMPRWQPGKVGGKNVRVKLLFPIYFGLDGDNFTGQRTGSTYNEDLRQDFENNLTDAALQQANANVLSYYLLSTSRLGWINCDRFLTTSPRTTFSVFTGTHNNASVKLIFEKYKAVIPGYYIDGYYQFANVPTGEPVTIIAIRSEKEGLMLATKRTIIKNETDSALHFRPVTVAVIKAEMKKLGKMR
jgi:TonB family protein